MNLKNIADGRTFRENLKIFKQSMKKQTTNLESNRESLRLVDIRRGVFQRDSLSSLLFLICLIPMSTLLRRTKQGYSLSKNPKNKINYLLYMDDLKLYIKNKDEFESLVETVRIFTEDVRMSFVQKCAMLTIKRGMKEDDMGILLLDDRMMKDLGEGEYRHLGVLKACKIKIEKIKKTVTKEYKGRLKLNLN